MPHGVAVFDAFKNLIRHGRQHRDHHHNHGQPQPLNGDESGHPPTTTTTAHDHHEAAIDVGAHSRGLRHQAPQQAHDGRDKAHRGIIVESIVQEERQAKARMPIYPGLEDYKLVLKMGDGAFSNVYKATETLTGRRVAIKVVRKNELTASQAGEKHLNHLFKKKPRVTERSNVLKEVQIMRGTVHPSIVKLFAFSESPDHYFLVMELMEGGELFHQIVKMTYFSENLSRHVILQVAQGIRYLHEERGVVHRDIKPENLLFEPIEIIPSRDIIRRPYDEAKEDEGEFVPGVGGGGIGRVKIADFGLSKVVWNEETMTPCGTVGYTAPEIVRDERYSKSVDMWALGCVLYTVLCGFPPFYDESIQVLTEKVAKGQYTFLSPWWDDVSHSSKELISHLLCVDPVQRYTIDEFLAHPWCLAAPAPPPPPTPYMYPHLVEKRPLDSPLLRGHVAAATAAGGPGRPGTGMLHEGRSPGVSALKEAFDITYAVHRMEEEGARRRKDGVGRRAGGTRGFLAGLNEDDEEDDDDTEDGEDGEESAIVGRPGNTPGPVVVPVSISRHHQHHQSREGGRDREEQAVRNVNTAGSRRRKGVGGTGAGGFELAMHNATLLGRRQRGGSGGGGSGPAVANGLGLGGSPLRVEASVKGMSLRDEEQS